MLGLLVKSAAPPNFCTRFAKFMAVQPSALSSSMSERKQMFLRLAAPPGLLPMTAGFGAPRDRSCGGASPSAET